MVFFPWPQHPPFRPHRSSAGGGIRPPATRERENNWGWVWGWKVEGLLQLKTSSKFVDPAESHASEPTNVISRCQQFHDETVQSTASFHKERWQENRGLISRNVIICPSVKAPQPAARLVPTVNIPCQNNISATQAVWAAFCPCKLIKNWPISRIDHGIGPNKSVSISIPSHQSVDWWIRQSWRYRHFSFLYFAFTAKERLFFRELNNCFVLFRMKGVDWVTSDWLQHFAFVFWSCHT